MSTRQESLAERNESVRYLSHANIFQAYLEVGVFDRKGLRILRNRPEIVVFMKRDRELARQEPVERACARLWVNVLQRFHGIDADKGVWQYLNAFFIFFVIGAVDELDLKEKINRHPVVTSQEVVRHRRVAERNVVGAKNISKIL